MSDTETPTTRDVQNAPNASTTTNSWSSREEKNSCEVPKLRSDDTEEYEIWRDHIRWWQMLTKIPKNRQAPHVILNAIHVRSVHKIVRSISHQQAETEEGLNIVLEKLDKHFLPYNFARKMQLFSKFKHLNKTDTMTWSEYIQKMKEIRMELQTQDMEMNDEMFIFAMLEGTKLDTAMRLSVESIARDSSNERKLTVHGVEDAILRLKSDEQKSSINHCEEDNEKDKQQTDSTEEAHLMRHSRGNRRPWNRGRGFGRGYNNQNIKRKPIRCYKCDEPGHYSYECPKQTEEKTNIQKRPKEEFTGYATAKDESSESEDIFFLMDRKNTKSKNDNDGIQIIIDTGASKSVIS